MRIDASPKDVQELIGLDTNVSFTIPKYQRHYIWEPKRWKRLFNDIKSNPSHFLGTILCINRGTDSHWPVLEVIDGQQRLTTISLMLAATYATYQERECEIPLSSDLDRDNYRTDRTNLGRRIVKGQPRLRLSFIEDNHKDYEAILKELRLIPGPALRYDYGNSNLHNAYDYFLSKLRAHNLDELKDFLSNLNSATLVKIEVDSAASAYNLFENLNDTGAPLTAIDLVKNLFFQTLELSQNVELDDEEALGYWNDIFASLPHLSVQ
ncbi:DUF262 domain-containing protein [Methanoculleus sp.]|jgi:uncharacterized protein with ParB-like and HNH nuclease domain|uniref:DUF262 domain-containing protein n=1 Tax=Methanoculleus sp. TaxID=90427 RepID=UPI001BD5CBCB|nr:DUF262 domain-containing protein [Methanoculleus sp.]